MCVNEREICIYRGEGDKNDSHVLGRENGVCLIECWCETVYMKYRRVTATRPDRSFNRTTVRQIVEPDIRCRRRPWWSAAAADSRTGTDQGGTSTCLQGKGFSASSAGYAQLLHGRTDDERAGGAPATRDDGTRDVGRTKIRKRRRGHEGNADNDDDDDGGQRDTARAKRTRRQRRRRRRHRYRWLVDGGGGCWLDVPALPLVVPR